MITPRLIGFHASLPKGHGPSLPEDLFGQLLNLQGMQSLAKFAPSSEIEIR